MSCQNTPLSGSRGGNINHPLCVFALGDGWPWTLKAVDIICNLQPHAQDLGIYSGDMILSPVSTPHIAAHHHHSLAEIGATAMSVYAL